jgi:nucleotidyltransferase substrate binding protein (TIGR01987 family)
MDESTEIRWQQRFENLKLAYQKLQLAINGNTKKPDDELIQIALIKTFEMTFELSWKTMKDYLKYNGIDASFPRDVLKQAFAHNIIQDGQLWIDMLEDRNLMSHTYDSARALKAKDHICQRYITGVCQLYDFFQKRLT